MAVSSLKLGEKKSSSSVTLATVQGFGGHACLADLLHTQMRIGTAEMPI